jgi:hypothetical protein
MSNTLGQFIKKQTLKSFPDVKLFAEQYYQTNALYNSLSINKKQTVISAYCGSYLTPLDMIIVGDSPSVWKPSVLVNFGMTTNKPFPKLPNNPLWVDPSWKTDPSEKQPSFLLEKQVEQILVDGGGSSGSVLYDYLWSLLCNDSFVQGAMDAEKEIHVAVQGTEISDVPMVKIFDVNNKRPRVLGRELLFASHNGYRAFDHDFDNLGIVLLPGKQRKFSEIDLENVCNQIKTESDMQTALKESLN